MNTLNTDQPRYETFNTQDDEQLMMSRMNWMTYLKVLFDKLTQEQSQQNIDIFQLLDALSQIKNLLPLQNKDEYQAKHGSEKGFTVTEVEHSLKQNLIQKGCYKDSFKWDDIIDLFLSNKIESIDSFRSQKIQDQDDLVNVSGECNIEEDMLSRAKPSIFKDLKREEESSSQRDTSGISKMINCQAESPFWKFMPANDANNDSPPVDQIAKKIEFRDSTSLIKNYKNNIQSSSRVKDPNRTESRASLNNQNCSFYLTPSSGIQTPSLLQSSKQLQMNQIMNSQTPIDQENDLNIEEGDPSSNSRTIFAHVIPFESFTNSQQFKSRRLVQICQMIDENSCKYYDINYSNMKAVSSLQMPVIKRDQKQLLRGINLSKNMFSRIYMLHPLQQQQLLILNMSHNLIQSLTGIEKCVNLQFLNLSHNMITDASQLQSLKYLQEIYLSHNLISSLFINQNQGQNQEETGSWTYLEVLDLSFNKLNDFEEVFQLLNGMIRKDVIKILAIKGNSFYNKQEGQQYQQINSDISDKELIDLFSNYSCVSELSQICFGSNQNIQNITKNTTQWTSMTFSNINPISMIFANRQDLGCSTRLSLIRPDHRTSKTRLDIRTSKNITPTITSRSTSRNNRPITSLYQSSNFANNRVRTSTSLTYQSKQTYQPNKGSVTRAQPNYNPKTMSNQFKKVVTLISKNLSLKNKQGINFTKIEKPLSRNVKFLDLSNDPNQNSLNNGNKSQLSFASSIPSVRENKSIMQSTHHYYKRSVLNNQLKKSIDLTLSCQTTKQVHQIPHTTKHSSSNSFSFSTHSKISTTKQYLGPSKRKQTSPIKPIAIRDKSTDFEQPGIVYEVKSNDESSDSNKSKEKNNIKCRTFIYKETCNKHIKTTNIGLSKINNQKKVQTKPSSTFLSKNRLI